MESESFIMTVTIYLIFLQLNVFTQTDNMAKRKGQAMLDRVSKMARALGEEKGDVFVPMDTALEENESKEEYFTRVLKNSTNMDRVLEFLVFKREGDKLLPQLRDELVKLVHRELQVEEALKDLTLERRMTAREGTPLLDALGAKHGKSFSHILAPPTFSCLLCSRTLKKHNEPSIVVLFTLEGPVVASKHIWRCRDCKSASMLSQPADRVDGPSDVHYGPASYGNPQVTLTHLCESVIFYSFWKVDETFFF